MKNAMLSTILILLASTSALASNDTTESTYLDSAGTWTIVVTKDKFELTPVGYYTYTKGNDGAMLIVQCNSAINVQISGIVTSLGNMWEASKPVKTKIRFGKGKTRSYIGKYPHTIVTDGDVIIPQMKAESTMTIKTSHDNEQHFFEFNLVGSTKAINKVKNLCNKIGK